jgi:ABC-2 type transport system permease protein
MRKTFTLVRREYKAAVHTKGFVIGLLVAPLFMGGSLFAMLLFKGQVDTTDKLIAVIDRSGIVAQAIVGAAEERNAAAVHDEETGKKVKPAFLIEMIEPNDEDPVAQRLELSDRVRRGSLHAFMEIDAHALHPRSRSGSSPIRYYAKNAAMDEVRGWIEWPINGHLRWARAEEAGMEQEAVGDLFDWVGAEGLGLVSMDSETGRVKEAKRSTRAEAFAVPFAMVMLMFMMIMMGAVPQLQTVMEEKSQRIAEVLLGSVKPSELMAGKVLGGLAVSLTASVVYVAIGFVAVRRMDIIDSVPLHILPWFFGYMVLAIVMMGAMMAALGSTCNEAKEAQSMTPLAMFPVLIPMFLMVPVITQPNSTFATYLSLFPPFTPMLMMIRLATPTGVALWQPVAGMIGMVIFTIASVWAAGRIFHVGILMQGQPPKLGNIVRWALRG